MLSFLGLDIDTLIEVRRAQLAYKLSDEVTLLFFKNITAFHALLLY
jgi:hypothetical protein